MSTRAPAWSPAPDRLGETTLFDPHMAAAALLSEIDAVQHALATGRGWPAQFRSVEVTCTSTNSASTAMVIARIPPGVEHVHVGAVVSGIGTVRITSSAFADGTAIDSEGCLLFAVATGPPVAAKLVSSSVIDDAATDAPRAVRVSASPVLEPQMVRLDVEVLALPSGSPSLRLLGLFVAPVHVPLSV